MVRRIGETNTWILEGKEVLRANGEIIGAPGDTARVEDYTFLVPPQVVVQIVASGKKVTLDTETFEGWTRHIEEYQ